jgi:hypothetical protein
VIDISDGGLVGSAIVSAGGAVWGILWLRKNFSGIGLSVGKDDAERNTMTFLVAERDNYATLYKEALAATQKAEVLNERLTGRVESLTRDNAQLSLQVSRFELELKGMRKLLLSIAPERASEIFNSSFSPLDGSS